MIYNLFIKNCGEEIFREHFASLYEKAEREASENGVFFLMPEYIESVNEETDAYPRILSLLIEEAKRINENPPLMKYALFIHEAMKERKLFCENLKYFMLPEGYELFAFLCLVPMIKNTYEVLSKMGIDEDIVNATVRQYEECVFIYERRFDRLGMNKRYFDWLQHYVDCEILNINRLRFEIHYLSEPVYMLRRKADGEDILVMGEGEFNSQGLYSDTPPKQEAAFRTVFTETESEYVAAPISEGGRATYAPSVYTKTEYDKVLGKGDCVLSVHIPVEGEFTADACKESYRRAKAVFARFFPELDVKGFVCYPG